MAISIIVEDGGAVDGANSFADIESAREYALNRGITLPSDDDKVASMLIRASDYIEVQDGRFQGKVSSSSQPLCWPRTGVMLGDEPLPSNVIPKSLISAQIQLVMAINAGFDLQPNISPSDYVKREKVGPIETEYSDPLSVGITPTFTAVNALLAPLFGELAAKRFTLSTVRV